MNICKRCLVSGRVQGVFYRLSTQQQASVLQLSGWAKNLSDGSVEVIACGDSASVKKLCQWLWHGPVNAHVLDVQCEERAYVDHAEFLTE